MKCLETEVDKILNWHHEINTAVTIWNRANLLILKIMHFMDEKTHKVLYDAISEPQLYYSSSVWTQNVSYKKILFFKINHSGLSIL